MEYNTPNEENISVIHVETCDEEVKVKQKVSIVESTDVHHDEAPVNIVIVGIAGCGKTSLVNKLCGYEDETLKNTPSGTLYEEHRLKVDGKIISIYDTQGLTDPIVNAKEVLNQLKKIEHGINALVICLKLYDKVDSTVIKMMENIKMYCGRDIFNCAVFALTQADEYKVHCRNYRENQGEEAIKEECMTRVHSMKEVLQDSLVKDFNTITEDQFSHIPVCVSSCYESVLPTTDDWKGEIWKHMLERCKEEAIRPITRKRGPFLCCFCSSEKY